MQSVNHQKKKIPPRSAKILVHGHVFSNFSHENRAFKPNRGRTAASRSLSYPLETNFLSVCADRILPADADCRICFFGLYFGFREYELRSEGFFPSPCGDFVPKSPHGDGFNERFTAFFCAVFCFFAPLFIVKGEKRRHSYEYLPRLNFRDSLKKRVKTIPLRGIVLHRS